MPPLLPNPQVGSPLTSVRTTTAQRTQALCPTRADDSQGSTPGTEMAVSAKKHRMPHGSTRPLPPAPAPAAQMV